MWKIVVVVLVILAVACQYQDPEAIADEMLAQERYAAEYQVVDRMEWDELQEVMFALMTVSNHIREQVAVIEENIRLVRERLDALEFR